MTKRAAQKQIRYRKEDGSKWALVATITGKQAKILANSLEHLGCGKPKVRTVKGQTVVYYWQEVKCEC